MYVLIHLTQHCLIPDLQTVNRQRGALIDVDPRVDFLATSNNTPMERERLEMSATLVRVHGTIKALGQRHAARQANLDSYAAKLAALVHPLRLVPPKILIEIFSYVTAFDPDITCDSVKYDSDFVDSLNTKSGVWALKHVCVRWRDIVTTTSSLWATVGLHFDRYSKSSESATANILATYLARSYQHDLNVIIKSEEEISNHTAVDVLLQTCEQWRGGWFALHVDTFLAWQRPFPFKQMNKLRVYILSAGLCTGLLLSVFMENNWSSICCAFGDAPRLVDVGVNNHAIFHRLVELDWAGLRVFTQEKRLDKDLVQGTKNSAQVPAHQRKHTSTACSEVSRVRYRLCGNDPRGCVFHRKRPVQPP